MARNSFTFHAHWKDYISSFPPTAQADMYNSIVDYAVNGHKADDDYIAQQLFLIYADIDRDNEIRNQRVTNGRKGGRPKAEKREPRKRVSMIKPEIEECQKYAISMGYTIDVGKFYDYYEARGWRTTAGPMTDWKAAMRYWTSNAKNGQPPKDREKLDENGNPLPPGITRTEWLKKRKWFEANHKALLALSAAQWMQFRGLCLNNEEAVKAILQRIIIDDFTDMDHFAERVMELREQQPYHSMIFG